MNTKEFPLVSIVMKTKNRSALLREALKYLTSQTYSPLEIFVIDHDSTDDTREVIRSFGEMVRYYKHTGTYLDTYNVFRDKVRGEFFSFMDDDDYITPDCIQKLVNVLLKNEDIDIVFARKQFFRVLENRCSLLEITKKIDAGMIKKHFLRKNIVHYNSVLIRRRCLESVPKLKSTLTGAWDWFFWSHMLFAGFKFYQLDEILGFIQRRHDSVQFELERMSKGSLECVEFYGKNLNLFEKISFGYWNVYGTRLINYGTLLLEKGNVTKGRHCLLKGIFKASFGLKDRKKYFVAILIWITTIISDPMKAKIRVEKLLANYYFRNYYEIQALKKKGFH